MFFSRFEYHSFLCFMSICDLFAESPSSVNIQNGLAFVNKVKLSLRCVVSTH
jgi:hypothetical protein